MPTFPCEAEGSEPRVARGEPALIRPAPAQQAVFTHTVCERFLQRVDE